jgi:hypothetical protein
MRAKKQPEKPIRVISVFTNGTVIEGSLKGVFIPDDIRDSIHDSLMRVMTGKEIIKCLNRRQTT